MIDTKFERISRPDDPRRCQNVMRTGQCQYVAVEDSTFCHMHQGRSKFEAMKKITNAYRLAQWNERVAEFTDDDQLKSLRGEIGILRLTLEHVVIQCQTPTDLMIHSAKIGDLVSKIDKVVTSCSRLEVTSSNILDKSAALSLAASLVEIISQHVPEDKTDLISEAIISTIMNLGAETPELMPVS